MQYFYDNSTKNEIEELARFVRYCYTVVYKIKSALFGIAMIAIPTGIVSSAFINIVQARTHKATEERLKRLEKKEKSDL